MYNSHVVSFILSTLICPRYIPLLCRYFPFSRCSFSNFVSGVVRCDVRCEHRMRNETEICSRAYCGIVLRMFEQAVETNIKFFFPFYLTLKTLHKMHKGRENISFYILSLSTRFLILNLKLLVQYLYSLLSHLFVVAIYQLVEVLCVYLKLAW